jgi:hypothetical protein
VPGKQLPQPLLVLVPLGMVHHHQQQQQQEQRLKQHAMHT